MKKFINRDKKSYKSSYVISSIKNQSHHHSSYDNCIDYYNDNVWCNQFLSQIYSEFEIVIVKDIKGLRNGFYVVDRNYKKFINSSFISKKIEKIAIKEMHSKPLTGMTNGFIQYTKTHSKKIDKYFVEYIKDNTILFYNLDNFKKEFNPQLKNNTTYKPHHKLPHSVNGFWRNQPYGSRKNPKYKRIWINDFKKGVS